MQDLQRLLDIMQQLRDPENGCPWDREQTFASLVEHTLEESYEVADSIDREDYAELREELGDLLFQIVFYAQLGKEQGLFEFADISRAIADKLVRRHPHVFADEQVGSVEEQTVAWETHKRREREAKQQASSGSELDGVIRALPSLSRAQKLQRRAARVGFDWEDITDVYAKLDEEVEEVQQAHTSGQSDAVEEEVGDLLFSAVNLARFMKVDAENALRRANLKFERRFRQVENLCREQGQVMQDMSVTELDALWEQVKTDE